MDAMTGACALFASAGVMASSVFRRPIWMWSGFVGGPGLVVGLAVIPADLFAIVGLIYSNGWLSGFGTWMISSFLGGIIALPFMRFGWDSIVTVLVFIQLVVGGYLLYQHWYT